MTSREPFDDLEAELLALGDALDVPAPPPPADVAAAVRARLESPVPGAAREARPAPRRRRARWKIVTAVVLVVIAITAATPQGRAAVATILRYAGIELRIGEPAPAPTSGPSPLPGERTVKPGDLPGLVRFPVRTPAALGEPDEVRVSDHGRVVSMFWKGVRLDQFDGGLSPVFLKEIGAPWPEEVTIGTGQGWWITGEHRLSYLKRDDDTALPLRTAAQTLIWERDGIGYRLEGAKDKDTAAGIAASLG